MNRDLRQLHEENLRYALRQCAVLAEAGMIDLGRKPASVSDQARQALPELERLAASGAAAGASPLEGTADCRMPHAASLSEQVARIVGGIRTNLENLERLGVGS